VLILRPSEAPIDDSRFQRQFLHDFRVHGEAVLIWLTFLKAHHPDYQYITISTDRLQALPVDGDVSASMVTITKSSMDDPGPVSAVSIERDLPPPNSSSMVLNTNSDSIEQDQIFQEFTGRRRTVPGFLPAPSIHMTPIDKAVGSERIFAIAFPTLYPIG
jgi:hypothetical protein